MNQLIKKIEACNFECEAGPLSNSCEWQILKEFLTRCGDEEKYAEVVWVPEDVKTLAPQMTYQEAEAWLSSNQKYLRDRLTELGWEVMGGLLPPQG